MTEIISIALEEMERTAIEAGKEGAAQNESEKNYYFSLLEQLEEENTALKKKNRELKIVIGITGGTCITLSLGMGILAICTLVR